MKSCAATHSAQSTARNSKSALQANINGASPSEGQAQAKPRKHKRSTVVRKATKLCLECAALTCTCMLGSSYVHPCRVYACLQFAGGGGRLTHRDTPPSLTGQERALA
eukprot:scaffold261371_cov33-Tisochrysis_lutea.AAC.4